MPTDAEKRAAALQALSEQRPAQTPAQNFWEQHGGKVIFAAALVIGVWIVAAGVGKFMRHSMDEQERAQETIRRGLR